MSLGKNQIVELQKLLTPVTKKFNILQVIQRFPDNQHMHETFRQICLHYESSCLSFNQIMQYLFGQFNKINSQSVVNSNQNKTSIMRVAKNQTQQQFKVALLGPQTNSERIKQLVMINDVAYQNKVIQPELYAVTNTSVRQFNMVKQKFMSESIKLSTGAIEKVSVFGNLILYVNKQNEIYLQILPHKLAQLTKKQNKNKPKVQISQTQVTKIPKQQKIISIQSFNQQQHLVCTTQKLRFIQIPLSSLSEQFKPQIQQLTIEQSSTLQITSMHVLQYPYVAFLTNSQSLIIVNAIKMKVTNRIYNDVNFASFAFNEVNHALIVSDFGGYLMSMSFNRIFGDLQEQGISFKKRNKQALITNSRPSQFQTYYINKNVKQKSPFKRATGDPPSSKQHKTVFSMVVQNTNRYVLQIIVTKQKSIFSYEGKFQNIIKIWNLTTLMVYQKIELTIRINQMKLCRNGLYLISSEKGYLCYYPLEKPPNPKNKITQLQILEMAVNSNIVYVSTTDMSENLIFKLRLSNKPSITQYSRKASKNAQKDFKYAFYKNQVILFNIMKSYEHQLQLTGIFGENKQTISDIKDYNSMIKYKSKEGVILWGNKRFRIRCKYSSKKTFEKSNKKGIQIVQTYNDSTNPNNVYNQTVIVNQSISKIKCFQHYITVICNSNKNGTRTNNYIIDQNAMCLVLFMPELSPKYRILECHRNCSIIMRKQKTDKKEIREFFLFDHDKNKRLWKSQDIEGWSFQNISILSMDPNYVQILCIYKSATITQDLKSYNKKNYKPLFYLIKIKVRLTNSDEKKFVTVTSQTQTPKNLSNNQTYQIEQIMNRSIYNKISNQQIQNSKYVDPEQSVIAKNNYKIYFPFSQFQNNKNKTKINKDNLDLKSVQGKLLHYEKSQNAIMFGLHVGSLAILYQMEEEVQAQLIGILNFDNSEQEMYNDSSSIHNSYIYYWNQNYKRDDQLLWESAKNRAINRIKHNSASPILSRADSLRQTKRKFNPQILQQNIVIPDLEQKRQLNEIKSKSYNKIISKTDPIRVNQLIYKHNIHQNIIKQNSQQKLKYNEQLTNKMRMKTEWVSETQVKGLINTIRRAKQTLSKQRRPQEQNVTALQRTQSTRKIKTQTSQLTSLKRTQNSLTTKSKTNIKQRYQTPIRSKFEQQFKNSHDLALEQLQKSKILEQALLPKIATMRSQSLFKQENKKIKMYEMQIKKRQELKSSRKTQESGILRQSSTRR